MHGLSYAFVLSHTHFTYTNAVASPSSSTIAGNEHIIALDNAAQFLETVLMLEDDNSKNNNDKTLFVQQAFGEFEHRQRDLFQAWEGIDGHRSIAIKHSHKLLQMHHRRAEDSDLSEFIAKLWRQLKLWKHEIELHSWIRTLSAEAGEDGQSKQPIFSFSQHYGERSEEIISQFIAPMVRHSRGSPLQVAQIGPLHIDLFHALQHAFPPGSIAFHNIWHYSKECNYNPRDDDGRGRSSSSSSSSYSYSTSYGGPTDDAVRERLQKCEGASSDESNEHYYDLAYELVEKRGTNNGTLVRRAPWEVVTSIANYSFDVLLLPPSHGDNFQQVLEEWEPKVKFAGILGGWYDEPSMKSILNRQRGLEVFLGMNRTFWWYYEFEEEM